MAKQDQELELGQVTFSERVSARLITLLTDIRESIAELIRVEKEPEVKYDGIIESFEFTATTEDTVWWAPVDKNLKREKWLWVIVKNDSSTVDINLGINGAANITVKAGEKTSKLGFGDKRLIEYVRIKTDSGTAAVRLICGR